MNSLRNEMFVDTYSLHFRHYTMTYSEQMLLVWKEVNFGCLTSYKMQIMLLFFVFCFFFKWVFWLKSDSDKEFAEFINSKCTQAFKCKPSQFLPIFCNCQIINKNIQKYTIQTGKYATHRSEMYLTIQRQFSILNNTVCC